MKSKREIINELKNVKLVIGNGFDLYCGLKTSYSDYFNNDSSKNEKLEELVSGFSKTTTMNLNFSLDTASRNECWKEIYLIYMKCMMKYYNI